MAASPVFAVGAAGWCAAKAAKEVMGGVGLVWSGFRALASGRKIVSKMVWRVTRVLVWHKGDFVRKRDVEDLEVEDPSELHFAKFEIPPATSPANDEQLAIAAESEPAQQLAVSINEPEKPTNYTNEPEVYDLHTEPVRSVTQNATHAPFALATLNRTEDTAAPAISTSAPAPRRRRPAFSFRHLTPEDVDLAKICFRLIPEDPNPEVLTPALRVGESEDGCWTHNVLSMWKSEAGSSLKLSVDELIGFVEYYHQTPTPAHITIHRIFFNPKYERHGFSRELVRELHRKKESVEVWSLWSSESFYKGLGYGDVMAPDGHRVQAEWGPLLVWVRGNEERNNRESLSGMGTLTSMVGYGAFGSKPKEA
ncbi:hypothetical protein HK104_000415 [Borealophlyctis nickersoniae]|nr:hypothetical protein HK104_000415 [Borealophlyctis nickersoniae]